MNATTVATTVPTATKEEVSFLALTTIKGKGVTSAQKVQAHINNGAHIGALIGAGIGRKASIDEIVNDGMQKTAHALSAGNIRPAAALVVAKSGQSVSLMEVDGKAPYSEWLRMGATLKACAQTTKSGKPTPAAKALALHVQLSEMAATIRANREANQKALANPV
jgi:hypothetical protein